MGPLAMVHIVPLISETRADHGRDVQIAMREMNLDCGQLHFHHTLVNIEAKSTNIDSLNPEKKLTALNFTLTLAIVAISFPSAQCVERS